MALGDLELNWFYWMKSKQFPTLRKPTLSHEVFVPVIFVHIVIYFWIINTGSWNLFLNQVTCYTHFIRLIYDITTSNYNNLSKHLLCHPGGCKMWSCTWKRFPIIRKPSVPHEVERRSRRSQDSFLNSGNPLCLMNYSFL